MKKYCQQQCDDEYAKQCGSANATFAPNSCIAIAGPAATAYFPSDTFKFHSCATVAQTLDGWNDVGGERNYWQLIEFVALSPFVVGIHFLVAFCPILYQFSFFDIPCKSSSNSRVSRSPCRPNCLWTCSNTFACRLPSPRNSLCIPRCRQSPLVRRNIWSRDNTSTTKVVPLLKIQKKPICTLCNIHQRPVRILSIGLIRWRWTEHKRRNGECTARLWCWCQQCQKTKKGEEEGGGNVVAAGKHSNCCQICKNRLMYLLCIYIFLCYLFGNGCEDEWIFWLVSLSAELTRGLMCLP